MNIELEKGNGGGARVAKGRIKGRQWDTKEGPSIAKEGEKACSTDAKMEATRVPTGSQAKAYYRLGYVTPI